MLSNFTATIRQTPPQHRIWDAHWALELEDSSVGALGWRDRADEGYGALLFVTGLWPRARWLDLSCQKSFGQVIARARESRSKCGRNPQPAVRASSLYWPDKPSPCRLCLREGGCLRSSWSFQWNVQDRRLFRRIGWQCPSRRCKLPKGVIELN